MFNKKQEKKILKTPEQQYVEQLNVHRIPDKYLGGGIKKKKESMSTGMVVSSGSGRKWAFLVGGLLVLLLVVIGILFFMFSGPSQETPQKPQKKQNTDTVGGLVNEPKDSLDEETRDGETVEKDVLDTEENSADFEAGDSEEDETPNEIKPDTFSFAPDKDQDGLSDAEEELYYTHPAKKDTDNDGYVDGEELRNLYDPDAVGATLGNGVSVKTHENADAGYMVLYPALWKVGKQDDSVRFESATGDAVIVQRTNTTTDFDTWYEEKEAEHGGLVEVDLRITTFPAYKSADGLIVYVMLDEFGEKFYTISYDPSGTNSLHYLSTFDMMIKSFLPVNIDVDDKESNE